MGKGQELLDAAREGDRKVVEKILAQITKRSGTLITSLRRGASVNVQDDNGYTPLHHACLRGHEEIVHMLLSVDASPCIVDKKGATALHLAAWKGDLKIVNMLLSLSNQPINIDQLTSDQETALIIASQFGFMDVVAQLLVRGADVSIKNKNGDTALDLAAHYGRLEVVQQLLYAKPHLVDRYRNPSGRNLLFPDTPLHRAAKHGHEEVVALLIAAGVDPNIKTINGTALHEAAYVLRDSVVRVLLSRGADLKAYDSKGKTVMDILANFSSKATKKVRKAIADRANGFDSDGLDDVPSFPVPHRPPRSPSDFYEDDRTKASVTPNIINPIPIMSSSHTTLTENHPQSFVKKLASKCLGIKAKFNSAPNVSNMSGLESEVTLKSNNGVRNSTNTMLIGNSKFFKRISKKDESGDVACNDEFDTISLDRLATIERTSVVNRSNRSCPGFKISLPNISENIEPGDSRGTSIISNESIIKVSSQRNSENLNIFEPRNELYSNRNSNHTSVSEFNECYESYEICKNANEPTPLPRKVTRTTDKSNVIYENVVIETTTPKPAIRTHINTNTAKDKDNSSDIYENFTPKSFEVIATPDPPKRTVFKMKRQSQIENNNTIDSTLSISRSSTLSSSSSMSDETNLEDILLSQKSKSFKHKSVIRTESSISALTLSSDITEASALEHIDCSDKYLYTTMTGTLPSRKAENVPKKKVLFRNKTFSTIDFDKHITDNRIKKDFIKENLVNYHIRGTGHCIYQAPSVKEFLEVFNRETLYVEPFSKYAKRDSYYETTICFCKPAIPKFYKSAEDLLQLPEDNTNNQGHAKIDTLKLINTVELNSTSFKCFCDNESCKFHVKKRESPRNLVVKFSAINKSISTPDISLAVTPVYEIMRKNMSFPPVVQEEPYTVVEVKDIISKDVNNEINNCKTIDSKSSTVSSSSGPQYSVKDVAEVLSLQDDNSICSNNTSVTSGTLSDSITICTQRQSTSSELSSHLSLQSCISSSTMASELSFKSCIAESDSDDGTLHSDDSQSDTDTVKSDSSLTKRPWVHSNSFNYGSKSDINIARDIKEESDESSEGSLEVGCSLGVASLECGVGRDVCSGSGRRWDEADGTSEGDALSISSAASSSAPHHLAHHHDFNKISPTPPKKPPRRNLSVSPTHANSPSSAYSYELRVHARSQDDLDDLQGSKHYLQHGRSVDQYVDSKLSYEEYPRVIPIPNPRPSLMNRTQPVAITAMYENVVIKEQNPRRKLRRNNFEQNYEAQKLVEAKPRKFSAQKSSLESLLDESPTNFERYYEGSKVQIPLSPTHYNQPPTPEHPPPSAKQAENSIHERIRPLSQLIMEVIEEIRIRKKSEADISNS